MIFMEGVIFITDEIITDILNIELKDLEDFQAIQKMVFCIMILLSKEEKLHVQTAVRIHAT